MPRGIFITYACDVIGSLAVNRKTAFTVFMPVDCVTEEIMSILSWW